MNEHEPEEHELEVTPFEPGSREQLLRAVTLMLGMQRVIVINVHEAAPESECACQHQAMEVMALGLDHSSVKALMIDAAAAVQADPRAHKHLGDTDGP